MAESKRTASNSSPKPSNGASAASLITQPSLDVLTIPRSPSNLSSLGSLPAMTVTGVLESNGGDYSRALEAVVRDRNHSVEENAGLWKIIQNLQLKADASRNTESRLRGERDRALIACRLNRAVSPPDQGGYMPSASYLPNSYSSLGLGGDSNPSLAGPMSGLGVGGNASGSLPPRSSSTSAGLTLGQQQQQQLSLGKRQWSEEIIRSTRGNSSRDRMESNSSIISTDTFASINTNISNLSQSTIGGILTDEQWTGGARLARDWGDLDVGAISSPKLQADSTGRADTGRLAPIPSSTEQPSSSAFNNSSLHDDQSSSSSSSSPAPPLITPTTPQTSSGQHSLSSPIILSKGRPIEQLSLPGNPEQQSEGSSQRDHVGRSLLDSERPDSSKPNSLGVPLASLPEGSRPDSLSTQAPTYVLSVSSPENDRSQRSRSYSASSNSAVQPAQDPSNFLASPLLPPMTYQTTFDQEKNGSLEESLMDSEAFPLGPEKELQRQQHLAFREHISPNSLTDHDLARKFHLEEIRLAQHHYRGSSGPLAGNYTSSTNDPNLHRLPSYSSSSSLANHTPRQISPRQFQSSSSTHPSSSTPQIRPPPSPFSSNSSFIRSGSTPVGFSTSVPMYFQQESEETISSDPNHDQALSSSPSGFQVRLSFPMLPYTKIMIPSCGVMTNEYGKDVVRFRITISVSLPSPSSSSLTSSIAEKTSSSGLSQPKVWKVDKLFSDFLALDNSLRKRTGRKETKALGIPSLPEAKAWREFSMSKVDQRKGLLEAYLISVLQARMSDKEDFCYFLSTDVIPLEKDSIPVTKEGYLTRRGQRLGGMKRRYFILGALGRPVMDYFETKGGPYVGSIPIAGAQIGRSKESTEGNDPHQRHAFLIIESSISGSKGTRHVLCAETDEDRDEWVKMLVRFTTGDFPRATNSTPQDQQAAEKSPTIGIPRSSTNNSLKGVQRKPSVRKLSKDDIIVGPAKPLSQVNQSTLSRTNLTTGPPASTVAAAAEIPLEAPPRMFDSGRRGSTSSVRSDAGLLSVITERPFGLSPNGNGPFASNSGAQPDSRSQRQSNLPPPRVVSRLPPPSRSPPITQGSLQEEKDSFRSRHKISGPQGGAPIPAGFKFGAKDDLPDRERKSKSGRWGFGFGKISGSSSHSNLVAARPVFAVPLAESVLVAEIAGLPAVVFRCIKYLEAKNAELEEGIYRLSGSTALIKSLRERFNTDGDFDLLQHGEPVDPHAIAGLLKLFLRELTTSLLTRELHMQFLAVIDLAESKDRIRELRHLVGQLPVHNYCLLRALTAHLILIVENAAVNKMTLRNVGIVFSPTLGIPAGVFSELVSQFQDIFEDPPEAVSGTTASPEALSIDPVDQEPTQSSRLGMDPDQDKTKRNSASFLSSSGAEQMLGLYGRKLTNSDQLEEESSNDGTTEDEDVSGEFNPSVVDMDSTIRSPVYQPPPAIPEQFTNPASASDRRYGSN
ncbi:Rac GTPase-activating protein BCR/ABR [Phaffia rhodozyma]|uniref:Rac GTPase-activating protein BCR/ABR n=1 Tax=Phaffia rhodozyma TaxID=264483 RepID=A0A0F7SQ11_PHARH|nr:Rac GTPase-activating protein BCR/ABR [Phaffia rhodozyma]